MSSRLYRHCLPILTPFILPCLVRRYKVESGTLSIWLASFAFKSVGSSILQPPCYFLTHIYFTLLAFNLKRCVRQWRDSKPRPVYNQINAILTEFIICFLFVFFSKDG